MFPFAKFEDIEHWLRSQWAGLFNELLGQMSEQRKLSTLTDEVGKLTEANKTLKSYLETIIENVKPEESERIIRQEQRRLDEAIAKKKLGQNTFVNYLTNTLHIDYDIVEDAFLNSQSLSELLTTIDCQVKENLRIGWHFTLQHSPEYVSDVINKARTILGLPGLYDLESINQIIENERNKF